MMKMMVLHEKERAHFYNPPCKINKQQDEATEHISPTHPAKPTNKEILRKKKMAL